MGKICCFTGHRDVPDESVRAIFENLEEMLTQLIENEGVTDFRAGGAIGFDTIAAIVVLKLKRKYPHIKLHLMLPCKNQDYKFTSTQKTLYKFTISSADSVEYIRERYSSTAMHARNRALVTGSDFCVYFLNHMHSGTYYTVNYARSHNVPVFDILKYKK